MSIDPSLYPSAVTGRVGFFDRFATGVEKGSQR